MGSKTKSFDYKWVVIALCFLMTFTCLGFCSSTKSIFILPVCDGIDISRTEFSVSDSIRYVSTAVMNLFFAVLIKRFGAKLLICAGVGALIVSSLIASYAQSAVALYVSGLFLGIGFAWTSTTMVGSVVNLWCKENKGSIMGAILASNGLGAALAVQILTPIIASSSTGFRDAYMVTVLILVVLLLAILLFFKDHPSAKAESQTSKNETKSGKESGDFKSLFRKPSFYVSLVCVFIAGSVLQSMHSISVPIYSDSGIDAATVATIVSIGSLFLTFTKFGVGFVYDRLGVRFTSTLCYSAAVISALLLILVSHQGGAFLATVSTLLRDVALPLETIMLPIYARELFGEKYFNSALGLIVAVNSAGYAVGGVVANLFFDLTGSYDVVLWLFGALLLFAMFALWRIISLAKRNKEA